MYPSSFDYYRAESVDEALNLLESHRDEEAKLLAGGHSLLPMMKQRLSQPGALIDIGRLDELRGVETNGDSISIGPLTTHNELSQSAELEENLTLLSEAAGMVGDRQVRNRGTIGGNLAHADPASDLPAPFLVLDGKVHARNSSKDRTIDAEDFFFGLFMTELEDNEIITSFEVPTHNENQVSAYAKDPSPSSGYAIVGVASLLEVENGSISSARIAANGAMSKPVRLNVVENALKGEPANSESVEEASNKAGDDLNTEDLLSDIQASSEYREQLLKVYSRRSLNKALERAN